MTDEEMDELRAGLAAAGMPVQPPEPLPEAQIMTLREMEARYGLPCPFKPGDLVTPIEGLGNTAAGRPAIILELFDPPYRPADGDWVSPAYAARLDVRVAILGPRDVNYGAFCVESWMLAPWTGPLPEAAP